MKDCITAGKFKAEETIQVSGADIMIFALQQVAQIKHVTTRACSAGTEVIHGVCRRRTLSAAIGQFPAEHVRNAIRHTTVNDVVTRAAQQGISTGAAAEGVNAVAALQAICPGAGEIESSP